MNCPKCRAAMEVVSHDGIQVDRCVACKGIWFDILEQKDLKKKKGSEAIDVGDPEQGKKLNKIGNISCPKGHGAMVQMVDVRQSHLWYEKCSACQGVFFDAGEFKDFKSESVMDLFRDLAAKERKG